MSLGHVHVQIDRYAYKNALAKNSPATKIIFALSTLIICVASPSPLVPIIVFLTTSTLLLRFAKIPVHFYWSLLVYPTAILIASCLIIALFFGYGESLMEIVLPWFSWTIFKNGVTMGIVTFFRVEGGLSCLYFLVLTTSMTDILITLRRAHLPMILIEISLLIYRYIFVFMEVAAKMYTAQKLRLGYSSWKKRIRSTALLTGNLFIRTLEQGERTFMAMNARGYDGKIRTLDDLPRPRILSLMGIIFFDIILVFVAIMTMHSWTL